MDRKADLQRASEHGDHQHDDGNVVCKNVPPWLQDPVHRLCLGKITQLGNRNHDGLPVKEKQREISCKLRS